MYPSSYFVSLHLALGRIWVWDPDLVHTVGSQPFLSWYLFHKNTVTFAAPRLKESVEITRTVRFCSILTFKLPIVIHTNNTTENTQSYYLSIILHYPLETNLVTFLLLLIWNYPLIPWLRFTQSQHAQLVQGVQTVPTLVFQMKWRGKSTFAKLCCCKGHWNRQSFCTQFQVILHDWTAETFPVL